MAGREFYTILTEIGKAKIADAAVLGTKINFITLKVGDGNGSYYEPGEAQVDLMHTVWSGPIANVNIDSNNSNRVIVDSLMPNDVGGFFIREAGIFDDNQEMLAVAKYPETYKPVFSNGAFKEVRIKLILEVSNTASISLEVNPTAAATQEDIQNLAGEGRTTETVKGNADAIANLTEDFDEHKAENETEFSSLNTRINNLNINDIEARNEIMDIKLKLKEQSAIDFINKTGVGFYDTFADNSNIDPETTASYDSENKNVNFPSIEPYTVKATSDYNDVALINVDKAVEVGDKLNNTNPVTMVTPVDSSMTYDRTTPVSVVNSAYVTSATARPQVLSNGWIVTCAYDNSVGYIRFYVSKDNGVTWTQLCYLVQGLTNPITSFGITSFGTNIYLLFNFATLTTCAFSKFDATTLTNVAINSESIDTNQTSFGSGCSIAVSSTGVLTAVWCSKNATYSNCYNIRSAKSVDGGITWTKQDGTSGVDQITLSGLTTTGFINPYIQYDKNDRPIVISYLISDASCNIMINIYNGTSWNQYTIYNSGSTSYTQSNPIATLQKYGTNAGRIWVTWCGKDSTDTNYNNIRLSYSDDNGDTWSTPQKLTSGNLYPQHSPTITSDLNGNIYVLWMGQTVTSSSQYNIRQVIWNGTTWGSITEITSQNTAYMYYPSTCDNYNNFTNPITIWQDNQNTRIAFYGKWTISGTTYDITLTDSITVSEGQELTIYPIEKILKMKDEVFDTFNNLDLSLYPNKINKATIKGAVNNSTTVITGATDKTLTTGDKLFMDGVLNEVLNATGNYTTNTVTDATVINQAYDTSGNGGRKLVKLSNGWLVATVFNSTNSTTYFYISKDNGTTWSQLCYSSWLGKTGTSIVSNGTSVYALNASSTGDIVRQIKFDAVTVTNIDIVTVTQVDTSQTAIGSTSLTINKQGTELHAAWSSKNSTYSNSFNIRYAKGTINSDGSVTWGSVRQVTSINASDYNITTPTIILRQDNNPGIISSYVHSSANYIRFDYYDGTEWHTGDIQIYSGGAYAQSNPCAIFVPQSINGLANGRIWVAWHGLDASNGANNIFVSYSDDGGVTWSSKVTITTGSTYTQQYPSITFNKNNEIFIVWQGVTVSNVTSDFRIKQIKNIGGTWGTIVEKKSQQSQYPSTLLDLTLDFSEALFIYQDVTNSKVGFYGTWTVGEGYTLTMQSPVTLTDGQQVPIVDFEVKQNNSNLELDNIDTEKFVFKGSNLNTDNASIKILGKDNKLNAIAYAVA